MNNEADTHAPDKPRHAWRTVGTRASPHQLVPKKQQELAVAIETGPNARRAREKKHMVALEGTRTRTNLEHAFTEEGRFNRRILKQELAAEAMGFRELAALSRKVTENGACFASGHLNLLVADDDNVTPSAMSPPDFAARMSDMIDDHTAMYAGMARTARDEGLEEIADWFETLAKAGRSHVRWLRRVLHE